MSTPESIRKDVEDDRLGEYLEAKERHVDSQCRCNCGYQNHNIADGGEVECRKCDECHNADRRRRCASCGEWSNAEEVGVCIVGPGGICPKCGEHGEMEAAR